MMGEGGGGGVPMSDLIPCNPYNLFTPLSYHLHILYPGINETLTKSPSQMLSYLRLPSPK